MPYDNLVSREKRMPSINPNAAHPDVTDLPDDSVHVTAEHGHEYGYIGSSPDTRARKDYTIAGVTGPGRNPGPTENVPESPRRASSRSKSGGASSSSAGTGSTSKS